MKLLLILAMLGLISCGKQAKNSTQNKRTQDRLYSVESLIDLSGKKTIETMKELERIRGQKNIEDFYASLDKQYTIECFDTCTIERK